MSGRLSGPRDRGASAETRSPLARTEVPSDAGPCACGTLCRTSWLVRRERRASRENTRVARARSGPTGVQRILFTVSVIIVGPRSGVGALSYSLALTRPRRRGGPPPGRAVGASPRSPRARTSDELSARRRVSTDRGVGAALLSTTRRPQSRSFANRSAPTHRRVDERPRTPAKP